MRITPDEIHENAAQMLISDKEMDGIMDEVEAVTRHIAEQHEHLPSMLLVALDRKATAKLPIEMKEALEGPGNTSMKNYEGKDSDPRPIIAIPVNPGPGWHNQIRALAAKFPYPAVAVFQSSEAWAASPAPNEMGKRPSKCAGRKEVILLSGLSIDNRSRTRMYNLHREGGIPEKGVIIWGELCNKDSSDKDFRNNVLRSWWEGYAEAYLAQIVNDLVQVDPSLLTDHEQLMTKVRQRIIDLGGITG